MRLLYGITNFWCINFNNMITTINTVNKILLNMAPQQNLCSTLHHLEKKLLCINVVQTGLSRSGSTLSLLFVIFWYRMTRNIKRQSLKSKVLALVLLVTRIFGLCSCLSPLHQAFLIVTLQLSTWNSMQGNLVPILHDLVFIGSEQSTVSLTTATEDTWNIKG